MIRIALDFADVKGGGGDHVREVLRADFGHKIGSGHLAPEFRFDEKTFEARGHLLKGIHY